MKKITKLYQKHRQLILYLVFGVITTVVSLLVCFLTLKIGVVFINDGNGEPTELLDIIGSTTQWISGVLVAFITNKLWVFTDAAKGARSTVRQLLTFSGSRVITYFLEVIVNLGAIWALDALGYTAFTLPAWLFGLEITSRVWAKVISSVLVVVSNYFISKLLVFRKKKETAVTK